MTPTLDEQMESDLKRVLDQCDWPDDAVVALERIIREAIVTLRAVKQAEPVAWRIRIGDSDNWSYTDSEWQADFYIKQSGLTRHEKQPLHAAPAAPQSGWQPIETAPKGPKVLVAYETAPGKWWRVLARYWPANTLESDHDESGFAEEGWYEATEAYEELMPVEAEPTFWHPLPAAPGREG